jgi:hypothetical protein
MVKESNPYPFRSSLVFETSSRPTQGHHPYEVAEGKGIEPLRRDSDHGLASQYLTARSTLRDYREGLDE